MNVDDLLAGYVAEELSDAERARVDAALVTSGRLRTELDGYVRLFVLLGAAAAEALEIPDNLHARIARQVAIKAYFNAAAGLVEGLLGAYGRAVVYYLRLA